MGKRLALWLAVVMIAAMALTACTPPDPTPPTPPETTKGGTLTIGVALEPVSLDIHQTSWADIAHALWVDCLVILDADNVTYVPWLAEDYWVSDDNREITFKLREDVAFHDGTPFNAEAVKFTYERFGDPAMAAPGASGIGPLIDIRIDGEHEVTLVYSAPYAIAFFRLGGSYFGFVSPDGVAQLGRDNFGRTPIGTGPYTVEEWNPGDSVVYARNPDYEWPHHLYDNQGPAYFERVILKVLPDETTRVLALEQGEIDMMAVPAAHVDRLRGNPDITLHKTVSSTVTYLGFNHSKEPWSNQKVRQALAHAVNREEIVQYAMEGNAVEAYNLMPPIMWGYWEGAKDYVYEQNPDLTRPLLAEAGWDQVDAEGFVLKDGKRLTLEIMTYSEPEFIRVTETVVTQLREAGVDATMVTLDRTTLLASTPLGDHDALCILYGFLDPDIFYYFFHTSTLPTTNRCHYVNPEMDELLDRGRTILDAEERQQIYIEAQKILLEDGVWVPLFTAMSVTGVRNEVQGFKLHPAHGGWLTHDAYKMVPK